METQMNAHTTSSLQFRHVIFVVLALASVGLLIAIRAGVNAIVGPITDMNSRVTADALYQGATVILALLFLLLVRTVHPQNFKRFARLGDSTAHPQPVGFLGIKATDTWRSVGIQFAIVVTIATAVFIFLNVLNSAFPVDRLIAALPFAVVFAVTNAFVEESLTRFGVVVPLHGVVAPGTIYIISALVFGIPHYFGTPGGVLGALMAGFLGWLLAKSMVETRGVWWAWFIHFLQDVVIITALLAVA